MVRDLQPRTPTRVRLEPPRAETPQITPLDTGDYQLIRMWVPP